MSERRALFDTTVAIDWFKMPERRVTIDALKGQYQLTFSSSIALLEFKAVVIATLINIYEAMRYRESFVRAYGRLIEAQHPQRALRGHILMNLLNTLKSKRGEVLMDSEDDKKLARKSWQRLQGVIPRAYDDFKNLVDAVLDKSITCTRASERPELKQKRFATNLPQCEFGKNRSCSIENVIRGEEARPFLANLKEHVAKFSPEDFPQLSRAIAQMQSVIDSSGHWLSHSECRRMGDALIALEGQCGQITHALSTNSRDWQPISSALGYEFVPIQYPV